MQICVESRARDELVVGSCCLVALALDHHDRVFAGRERSMRLTFAALVRKIRQVYARGDDAFFLSSDFVAGFKVGAAT